MNYNYYNSQEREEVPFSDGRLSSSWTSPSPFVPYGQQLPERSAGFSMPPPPPRVDGHGFPVPSARVDGHGFPISFPPAASSPVSSTVYWPVHQAADRTEYSTPPRTKRPGEKLLPGTPDTISSRQDEEERAAAAADIPEFWKEHEQQEVNSKSTSLSGDHTSDSSQPSFYDDLDEGPKRQWWPSQTKCGLVIALLMLLLVTMLITYFLLTGQKSDDRVPSTQFSNNNGSPRSPTVQPVASPSVSLEGPIREFLFQDSNVSVDATDPAVQKAVAWLEDESSNEGDSSLVLDQKYLQRFGILILFYSIDPNGESDNPNKIVRLPNFFMRNRDECKWIGITCGANGLVREIKLSNLLFDGTLPAEWGGFFPYLKSIDFSKNELQGSIPEGMYDILGLEEVHLYKNRLTGTISSKIGNLWSLKKFHLNDNWISGSIPPELGSSQTRSRPLRSFNVHRNVMTGTIPWNLRLRQLDFMDLGRNEFSGTLPPDLGTESVRLKHLYLDHNNFEGTFPSEILNAGDGRLMALTLNDNQFTGAFPGELSKSIMVELTIQNNNFVAMSPYTCLLDVVTGGGLVEFKTDCSICGCGDTYLCQFCEP